MNFFALSQAPPPLFSTVAIRMPPIVPTMSSPATASQPDRVRVRDAADLDRTESRA